MKIVSACLVGVRCGYDGEARTCPKVVALVRAGEAIPVCPEQLGGLTTPRAGAECQSDGSVRTVNGDDVTAQFERGVFEALKIAQLVGAKEVILKARSPMCGVGEIYDGSFTNSLIAKDGKFAQKLKDDNIAVVTDEEL